MGLTIWLIITVILIVVEIITLGLTSIWFAGGAFVAGLISLTGAHWLVQLLVRREYEHFGKSACSFAVSAISNRMHGT